MAGTQQKTSPKLSEAAPSRGLAALGEPTPQQRAATEYFENPAARLRERLSQPRLNDGVVTRNGRTYRWIDNGQALVLAPVATLGPTDEDAERARDAARLSVMLASPLAAVGEVGAMLAGASRSTRDFAMAAGAALDTVGPGLAAAASLSSRGPGQAPSPVVQPRFRQPLPQAEKGVQQEDPPAGLELRERPFSLDSQGRSTGAVVSVNKDRIGTGQKIKTEPPGYNAEDSEQHKGHLVAKVLGYGDEPWNRLTMYSYPNQGVMSTYEKRTAAIARRGTGFEYIAVPFYKDGVLIPYMLMVNRLRPGFQETPKFLLNRPRQVVAQDAVKAKAPSQAPAGSRK